MASRGTPAPPAGRGSGPRVFSKDGCSLPSRRHQLLPAAEMCQADGPTRISRSCVQIYAIESLHADPEWEQAGDHGRWSTPSNHQGQTGPRREMSQRQALGKGGVTKDSDSWLIL